MSDGVATCVILANQIGQGRPMVHVTGQTRWPKSSCTLYNCERSIFQAQNLRRCRYTSGDYACVESWRTCPSCPATPAGLMMHTDVLARLSSLIVSSGSSHAQIVPSRRADAKRCKELVMGGMAQWPRPCCSQTLHDLISNDLDDGQCYGMDLQYNVISCIQSRLQLVRPASAVCSLDHVHE